MFRHMRLCCGVHVHHCTQVVAGGGHAEEPPSIVLNSLLDNFLRFFIVFCFNWPAYSICFSAFACDFLFDWKQIYKYFTIIR